MKDKVDMILKHKANVFINRLGQVTPVVVFSRLPDFSVFVWLCNVCTVHTQTTGLLRSKVP